MVSKNNFFKTEQISEFNPAAVIRNYLKKRCIWQTFNGRYALNDEVSLQVRRDTLRFGIEEEHRLGV